MHASPSHMPLTAPPAAPLTAQQLAPPPPPAPQQLPPPPSAPQPTAEQNLQQLIEIAEEAASRYTAVRATASHALAGTGFAPPSAQPPSVAPSIPAILPLSPEPPPQPTREAIAIQEVESAPTDAAAYLALSQKLADAERQLRAFTSKGGSAQERATSDVWPSNAADEHDESMIARRLDLHAATATPAESIATATNAQVPAISEGGSEAGSLRSFPTAETKRRPPRLGADAIADGAHPSQDREASKEAIIHGAYPNQDRAYADAFETLEAQRQRHLIASADITRRLVGSARARPEPPRDNLYF